MPPRSADAEQRHRNHDLLFAAIESWDTFAAFANLNASLIAALRCGSARC
jgi:hypothetical protein